MRVLLLCIALLTAVQLPAQVQLDLQKCIDIAIENNLGLRQSENQVTIAEVAVIQRKFAFLPNAGAQIGVNRNIGQTVDNFSQQIAESPTTANPSLFASIGLFNGLSKWNALKSAQADVAAAQYSLEDLENDIRLSVALSYFQVIFSEDQLDIALERVELLEKQVAQTETLLEAGTLTKGDLYTLKAQLATEKVNLVNAGNQMRQNLLNLILAMNEDPSDEYELERPDIENFILTNNLDPIKTVVYESENFNPGLKSLKFQIVSREHQVKMSRAGLMPSLSLSYGIGSFYSSSARPLLSFENDPVEGLLPIYGDPPGFFSQIGDNIGQGLGLSLNIPIFQNYQVRQGVRNAQINLENARLSYENEKNNLYQSILVAYQDAEASFATYQATLEQIQAAEISFEFAKTRYEAGVIDFNNYLETLNNKTRAERELLAAKYDFILKSKILDLYQGKPLEF